MKNLSQLGFGSELGMFYPKNVEQLKELIGEKVYYTYSDYDNGSISQIININSITEDEIDEDGEGYYNINYSNDAGEFYLRVQYAMDENFDTGNFHGGIFAGDDMDRVLFKISE